MSLDKSLKSTSSLSRHRNVLTRAERITRLKDEDRWDEGRDPFGLPKVAHRKVAVGGKTKKKEQTEEGAAAAPAAAESGTKPAAKPPAKSAAKK